MKFKLITAGIYYSKEQAERLIKLGFAFEPINKTTFEMNIQGANKTNPIIQVRILGELPSIEINTLEELLAFSDEWGSLIIDRSMIQIFDDYLG